MVGLVQPSSLPLMTRPDDGQQAEADEHAGPGCPACPPDRWLSGRRSHASGMSTRPMGTLSQKIQCQLMPSTMAPPTRGPSATARPPMAPQAPSATPRRSAGTAALSRVRVRGTTNAAPVPWMARAMMSVSMLLDRAAPAEAQREQRQADHEHPAATEPVTQRGAGQQQHGEGQGVGVDRPLEAFERGVEVVAGWSGSAVRHDEVVEHHHQQGDGRDDEGPDARSSVVAWSWSVIWSSVSMCSVVGVVGWSASAVRSAGAARRSLGLGHTSLSKHGGPAVGRLQDVHRRHDVEQHAPAHEGGETGCLDPRHGRDVLGDLAEALPGRPDARRGRRRRRTTASASGAWCRPGASRHRPRRSSGSRACRGSPPRRRRRNRSRVSSKQRRMAARNSSFLVPYNRNR